MDKAVFLCTGESGMKRVYGQNHLVKMTPFVGTNRRGKFSELGVGVVALDDDGDECAYMWGTAIPHNLIQSWRAMKLIEYAPSFSNWSLCAFWNLGRENRWPDSREDDYLGQAVKLWGSPDAFRIARAAVLSLFPKDAELQTMLDIARSNDIEISDREIRERITDLEPADTILARLIKYDQDRSQATVPSVLAEEAVAPTAPPRFSWRNPATWF